MLILSYADLPNVDTFYFIISRDNITIDLIRKIFKYGKSVRFIVVDTSFPKFSFLLESSYFISGNIYFQFFSWKQQAHFIHFRKRIPKLQVWRTIVCPSAVQWSKNDVPWRKHLIQLRIQTVAQVFIPKITLMLEWTED